MKKFKIMSLLLVFYISGGSFLFALEIPSHKLINEYILKNNVGFSLDSYLKEQLDFTEGMKETFRAESGPFKREETKTAADWIVHGGKWEDKPLKSVHYIRSFNHYHDPMNKKGYNLASAELGESALQWAQKAPGAQSPDHWYDYYTGGNYSWHQVRGGSSTGWSSTGVKYGVVKYGVKYGEVRGRAASSI